MKTSLYYAAIALVASMAGDAAAQHFDIFLGRPATGTTTVIGGADVDLLAYDDVTRVFEAELGTLGAEFVSLEPGVNHPNINDPGLAAYPASATALAPGDVLSLTERQFTVDGNTDDLFFWNGVGAVSFTPAAANFRIDGADPLGSVAGSGGTFDDHPFLVVDSAATPGIYLASVVGTVNGFSPSAPVYLVMGAEDLITPAFLNITPEEFDMLSEDELEKALDGVIDAGIDYVQTNVVPEPASSALAVSAVGCLLAVGRLGGRRRAAGQVVGN